MKVISLFHNITETVKDNKLGKIKFMKTKSDYHLSNQNLENLEINQINDKDLKLNK